MENWKAFFVVGDEYLVSYFELSNRFDSCRYFLIGHALELYLKGVLLKQGTKRSEVFRMGHNFGQLLETCQRNDPSFLPEYTLRKNLINKPLGLTPSNRTKSDSAHLQEHFPLYQTVGLGGDAKYLGTIIRQEVEFVSETWPSSLTYWRDLFQKIAKHVEYKGERALELLEHGHAPTEFKQLVSNIFK